MLWKCTLCGYRYDPDQGDPDGDVRTGTPYEYLPLDWSCPECGASKDMFKAIDEDLEELEEEVEEEGEEK